jgi:hypothetical protein
LVRRIDVFWFDPTPVVTVVVCDTFIDEYSPPRACVLFAREEVLNLEGSRICIPGSNLGSNGGHSSRENHKARITSRTTSEEHRRNETLKGGR